MKMNIGKLRTLLKLPPPKEGGKPLTEEQKRKRAGYIVYPVLVLLCAGCVWLALSPSEKEQAKAGQGNGFNTEIPLPEDSRIQESKVAAYEHEELEKKEKERRSTYREMASLLDRKQADTVRLPDLPPEKPRKTAGQETARSPSAAYRDMNRTLNNFYEPAYDREKEELRKRVAELERRQAQQPEVSSEYSMEEKLALMEKSYELAARYNGGQAGDGCPAPGGILPSPSVRRPGTRGGLCRGKEHGVPHAGRKDARFGQEYHRRLRARHPDRGGRADAPHPPAGTDGGGRPAHPERDGADRRHTDAGGTPGHPHLYRGA